MLICVNLTVKKLFSSNLAQEDFGIMIRILSGYSWWVKWVPVLLGTSGVFSGIGVRPTPAMSCSKCRKLWEKRCKRSLRRGLPSTSVDQFFFLCHVPVSFTYSCYTTPACDLLKLTGYDQSLTFRYNLIHSALSNLYQACNLLFQANI